MLTALCQKSEFFRSRLNLAILLAPVCHLHNCGAKIAKKFADDKNVVAAAEALGPELFPNPQVSGALTAGLLKIAGQGTLGVGMMTDSDPSLLSQSALETVYGFIPCGTSFRCIDHFRQVMVNKEFNCYDFGAEENKKRYGTERAPPLDVS